MKWKNYKRLTAKQKEEYNYKFNKELSFPFQPILFIVFYLVVIVFTLLVFVMIKTPELFNNNKESITNMITLSYKLIYYLGWIYLIEFLIWFIYLFYGIYKKNKWFKPIKEKWKKN